MYKVVVFALKLYYKIFYGYKIHGIDNIPKDEGVIICPNHISNHDPLFVAVCIKGQLNFMAKEELFKNWLFKYILKTLGAYPVKRGGADIHSIKHTLGLLKADKKIVIFPEGTRSRNGELGDFEPGVSMLAAKSKKKVVPVYIKGNYKFFKKMEVFIGVPVCINDLKEGKLTSEDYIDLSNEIRNRVENLKK